MVGLYICVFILCVIYGHLWTIVKKLINNEIYDNYNVSGIFQGEMDHEIKINENNERGTHSSEINMVSVKKYINYSTKRMLFSNLDGVQENNNINGKNVKFEEVKHGSRTSSKSGVTSIGSKIERKRMNPRNRYYKYKSKTTSINTNNIMSESKDGATSISNEQIMKNDVIDIPRTVHTTVKGDCQTFWQYREWWNRLGYKTKCYTLMEQLAILEEYGMIFKSTGNGVGKIVKRRYLKTTISNRNNNQSNYKLENDAILVLDIQISDISRFLILHKYGGIYVDSDVKPNGRWSKELSRFVDPQYNVILGYEANMVSNIDRTRFPGVLPKSICMWTLISKPGSKVMLTIAKGLYKRIKPKRGGQSLDKYVHMTTGPSAVTLVVQHNFPNIQIAPVTLFGCGQRHSSAGPCGTPKNFVQHHFKGSWRKMATASSYLKHTAVK